MFFVPPLPRSWLLSCRANLIYSVGGLFALSYLGVLIGAEVAMDMAGATLLDFPLLKLLLLVLMFPGILGMATVWVAMWFFWWQFHPAETVGKGLWLLVLLLGPVGALFYLAFVYRRSPLLQQEGKEPATA